jgi:hypothetical protein
VKVRLISLLTFLTIANCLAYGATSASMSFDYATYNQPLNKTKILNLARGYQGPIHNLTWHNSFYGNMTTIGVHELRMDWLPSDSTYSVISRDTSGSLKYDFTKLDAIVVPLLQRGMRPVMCMHMENITALGITNGMPANMDDYAAVITAFVQHYKNLGYTGLVWESHNEPEYFTTLTAQQTYYMYDRFAVAVKDADPTAVVGGYGAGSDHLSYIGAFLDAYNGDPTKPPMDYFSYHQYGTETFQLVTTINNMFTGRGLTAPPFYLTEWNDFPHVQPENDTPQHAAWVAKKWYWALMHAPQLAKLHLFNYADGDTGKVFNGTNGLFTAGNHKKAAANTYNFFNNLCDIQLSSSISGQDTSNYNVHGIATRDPATGRVSLILWNHRSVDVNVSLQVSNLPYLAAAQNFVLTKYIIDSTNGNYYNDYLNNGALPWHTAVGQSENVGVAEITTLAPAAALSRSEYLPAWSLTQIILDPVSIFNPGADYRLTNCGSGLVMQINAATGRAEQGIYSAGANQKWKIEDLGTGFYKLTDTGTGLVLEVPGGSTANGTQLARAAWTGATRQQWQIVNAGSYYKILNRNSGLGVNVSGVSQLPGASVIQWTSGSGLNEFWKIQPAGPAPNQACRVHLKLDETTGQTAVDSSGFGNHGLLQGTSFSSGSVAGYDGTALNLDGLDDSVKVPVTGVHSNAVTITAWVRCNTAPVPWSGIVFNRTPNANGLNIGNGSELRYHWNNSMFSWISGLSLPTGTWTFVALVIAPDKGTIYMDAGAGLQSATNTAAHKSELLDHGFFIGYDPAGSTRRFRGMVDDVRIFNASLTEAQVAAVRDSVDPLPPSPNPMTWAVRPYETGPGEVTMTASAAVDPAGVQYYFECVSGGGHDSGWQDSPIYVDTNLVTLTAQYRVKARDKSVNANETAYSEPASVVISRYPFGAVQRTVPGVIQAEEFDVAGQNVSYYDTDPGNSSGTFRPDEDVDIVTLPGTTPGYAIDAIQAGEWLEYTVNSAGGPAEVVAFVASTTAGGQIRVWLENALLTTLDVPNTGALTSWQVASGSQFVLPEQPSATLRIEFVGSGFRLDWLKFERQQPFGSAPSPLPGTIRFVDYDLGGQAIAYYDRTAGNQFKNYRSDDVDIPLSNGILSVYADSGEWLEYTVDLLPGTYDISVRTSAPYNGQSLQLTLDGQPLANFTLPNTSSWGNWQTTTIPDVVITNGGLRVLRATNGTVLSMLESVSFSRHYNPADLDRNTQVDLDDFAILSAQWLGTPGSPSADIALPHNNIVDLEDLILMAEHWLVSE